MTALDIQRPDDKEREPNGINLAGDAYCAAADRLIAAGSTVPKAELIFLEMMYGRRRTERVPGELPRTQASIDLMRGSTESTIGMGFGDSRRYGILDACRVAVEVIDSGGNCIMNPERSGEQCLRYGAAIVAMQGTEVTIG